MGGFGRTEIAERLNDCATHFGVLGLDLGLQDLESFGEARASESMRSLGANTPKFRLPRERAPERGERGCVASLAERLGREPTTSCGRRIGELTLEHVEGCLELDVGEHGEVGIDDHEAGSLGAGERDGLGRLFDAVGVPRRFAFFGDHVEDERESEARRVLVDLLGLLDADVQHAAFVLDLHLEIGMAGPVDPLLEELLEPSARDFFERAHQIACLDDRPGMLLQVRADRAPEHFVAERGAQHVQDEPTFLVEVAIEDVDRRFVILANDGPSVATVGLAEISFEIAAERILVLVFAQLVLEIDVLEEGGEAFVQPPVRPIAARDVVAEPLVGELVGDEIVGGDVDRGALVEQEVLVHGGGGGVLHAAEDEIGDHDLRVLVPGVRDTDELAEVLDHLRRALEAASTIGFAALGHEVGDGHAARLAGFDLGELAGDQRDEVARQGIDHLPVVTR